MIKIYVLVDEVEEIRYVGITSRTLHERLSDHLADSRASDARGQSHKARWIRKMIRRGWRPQIRLLMEVDEFSWSEAETYWISYFKSLGCRLTNRTDGGEGTKGLTHSDEARNKISLAMRGNTRRLGVVTTPETRSLQSQRRREWWEKKRGLAA